MAEIGKPRVGHVAGFVKGPTQNKDNSVTFKVSGQKFVLSKSNNFVEELEKANRALIRFEEGRNPKIILVLAEPTARLIRQYMQ